MKVANIPAALVLATSVNAAAENLPPISDSDLENPIDPVVLYVAEQNQARTSILIKSNFAIVLAKNREVLSDLSLGDHNFSIPISESESIHLPEFSDSPEVVAAFFEKVQSLDSQQRLIFSIQFAALNESLSTPEDFLLKISADEWRTFKQHIWIKSLEAFLSGALSFDYFSLSHSFFENSLKTDQLALLLDLELRFGNLQSFENLVLEIFNYFEEMDAERHKSPNKKAETEGFLLYFVRTIAKNYKAALENSTDPLIKYKMAIWEKYWTRIWSRTEAMMEAN